MGWSKPEAAAEWQAAFGARVRELRNAQGVSQMDLAHSAGLDPTYLSSVELGRRNISLVNMHVLARALDVSVTAFFDGSADSATG